MANEGDDESAVHVGLAYPLAQLARVEASAGDTAPAKAGSWLEVVRGMLSGRLKIGSRTPVADTPAWVTLEVMHGGFASGRFAAGGPLDDFERSMAAALAAQSGGEREAINESFLHATHVADLDAWLEDTRYRVNAPEHAALLTAAWLAGRGESERAVDLLLTVRPWFDRLRFYPCPSDRPLPEGDGVSVTTVGPVREALQAVRPNAHVRAMNESILAYGPLCDRTVALWLETVEGELPDMLRDPEGRLVRDRHGQPTPTGGWPGKVSAPNREARTLALLADHTRARAAHRLTAKAERKGELYFELRSALGRWNAHGGALPDAEAGRVRRWLAAFVAAHGAPGSERHTRMREAQRASAALPLHADVARAIATRLDAYAPDDALDATSPVVADLTDARGVPIDAVPAPVLARLSRCVAGPAELLIRDGRISSAESLAIVVPALSAAARVASIDDARLRALVRATYLAFRRRRSLLLLNLESQVRFEELPWVKVVEPWMSADVGSRVASRVTLSRLVSLALVSFPQTVLPNRLMKEVRALVSGAGLTFPLVDEIAADIFMGTFRDTFLQAAKCSAARLGGTLYARYYGIPIDRVQALDDVKMSRYRVATSEGFDALCFELAGIESMRLGSVASSGAVVEWAQILTTHNLVPLLDGLGLVETLPLETMAQDAFRFVCRLLARPAPRGYIAKVRNKNAAYAFRQALCFVSLAGEDASTQFVEWARVELSKVSEHARVTIAPAVEGMERAMRGTTLGAAGVGATGRLAPWTGWVVTR